MLPQTQIGPIRSTSQFHVALRGDLDGTIAEPLLVFAFLLFDFVGRQLPVLGSPGRFVAGEGWLVGFVLLRMGFVPLYAVVALSTGTSAHVPEFIVMIPFAFSHGYCSTVCMMEAPRAAGGTTDEAARQRASVIMAALTNAGICIGALVAFAWLSRLLSTSPSPGRVLATSTYCGSPSPLSPLGPLTTHPLKVQFDGQFLFRLASTGRGCACVCGSCGE